MKHQSRKLGIPDQNQRAIPLDLRILFRSLEGLYTKANFREGSITFNQVCITLYKKVHIRILPFVPFNCLIVVTKGLSVIENLIVLLRTGVQLKLFSLL